VANPKAKFRGHFTYLSGGKATGA